MPVPCPRWLRQGSAPGSPGLMSPEELRLSPHGTSPCLSPGSLAGGALRAQHSPGGSPAPPERRWLSLPAAPPGPLSWEKEPPNLFPGVLSLSFHFSSAHAFFNQTAGAAVRCPPVLQGHTREFWTLSPPPRSPSRTPGTHRQQGLPACCPQGQEGRKSFYPKAKKL